MDCKTAKSATIGHFFNTVPCADIAEEESEGDDDTVLGELPLEVLQHMFSLLDPLTLGAASCVCTTWHALSQDESLWQRCLAQVAIGSSSSSSHTRSATRRQQFNVVVASGYFQHVALCADHMQQNHHGAACGACIACLACSMQLSLALKGYQQFHCHGLISMLCMV